MPLKQQSLEVSLGCRATRRLSRIGSHNCNWDSIESDDVIELLVDAAMSNGQWSVLLKLRGLRRGFRRVVNAKLDALLADLRSKADAARVETQSALETRTPFDELEALPACSAYAKLLDALFRPSLVEQLIKQRRVAGFWLVRDELLAWKLGACICCRKQRSLQDTFHPMHVVTGPVHLRGPRRSDCAPVARFMCKPLDVNVKRAKVIMNITPPYKPGKPSEQTLFDRLLDLSWPAKAYWVDPVPFLPRELTLVGASGMTAEEIDQAVAAKEAEDAIAAAAREARRTARRDAAVAKLETATEAYLSANVSSIPTLSRLQDLEDFYSVSNAIPPRPLPPCKKLPLGQVRFDYCMELFHQNVKDLA